MEEQVVIEVTSAIVIEGLVVPPGQTVEVLASDARMLIAQGIFDDPYLNAELGEYELDSTRPRLTCRWDDVRDVTRGDVVEIDGTAYDVVTNAQPDGTGMGLLALAEQRA
mgnify:CR=1 FL=1